MSYKITEKCIGCTACARICPVGAISGEKKEQHTIDAELCIDCGACGRACAPGAILDTEDNPVKMVKRTQWLKPEFNLKDCILCGACVIRCPADCLQMSEGAHGPGSGFPELILKNKCVSCGWCEEICPVDCIKLKVPAVVK